MNIRLVVNLFSLDRKGTPEPELWVYQFSPKWGAVPAPGTTIALYTPDDWFKVRISTESCWYESDFGIIELRCDNVFYSDKSPDAKWHKEGVMNDLSKAGFEPIDEVELWT